MWFMGISSIVIQSYFYHSSCVDILFGFKECDNSQYAENQDMARQCDWKTLFGGLCILGTMYVYCTMYAYCI